MLDPTLTPERLADIKAGRALSRDQMFDEAARQGRLKPVDGSAQKYRPDVLYADPAKISPRWPYAVMRIKRILEGNAKASTMERAVKGGTHRHLAQQFAEAYVYFMTRAKAPPAKGTDHNPFRRLSDGDATRKFVRIVEDICDRSVGAFGSWWVK